MRPLWRVPGSCASHGSLAGGYKSLIPRAGELGCHYLSVYSIYLSNAMKVEAEIEEEAAEEWNVFSRDARDNNGGGRFVPEARGEDIFISDDITVCPL